MLSQILFPLAKRFVSGHTIGEAIVAVRRLNEQGITATLDVLGENVTERKTAEAAVFATFRLSMRSGSRIFGPMSL